MLNCITICKITFKIYLIIEKIHEENQMKFNVNVRIVLVSSF